MCGLSDDKFDDDDADDDTDDYDDNDEYDDNDDYGDDDDDDVCGQVEVGSEQMMVLLC